MKRLTVQSNSFSHPEVIGFLFHNPATSLQFHSATGSNGRAAMPRRSASQQSVVRQDNSNPHLRRALPVAVGGTLANRNGDLQFPNFAAIAARRDVPLILSSAGKSSHWLQPSESANAGSMKHAKPAFEHPPLFRDRGIND
jgi:hypothetical protein